MKQASGWPEGGRKQEGYHAYRNKSNKHASYLDGTNVRAKTCECGGNTEEQDKEVRCIKCGREPKDKVFIA